VFVFGDSCGQKVKGPISKPRFTWRLAVKPMYDTIQCDELYFHAPKSDGSQLNLLHVTKEKTERVVKKTENKN